MKRQDKKKEQNGSANGDNLHVSENQTTDHEDIPLVLVNDGAESATVQAKQRKRSRAISSVSMSSDDEDTKEKQEGEFTGKKSTMLHQLILNGEVEDVQKLLIKGTSVNNKDRSGKTPLHTAILSKQFKVVDMLLQYGADVTVTDDAGDTPLHTAIYVGSERLVMTLLRQAGTDVNALGRGSCTPLHLAAEMDNDVICKILIENSGNTRSQDETGMTPLAHATERGAKRSAAYLLEHAKKEDAVDFFLYDVDIDGNSLLHLAVNSGVLEVVELCIEYGVRIRQPRRHDKITAFHMACEQGSMPIMEYLVSKDPAICRITLVDVRGRTPLHMAARKNHANVVEFLLEKEAVVDPKTDDRRTPLFYAADYGAVDVVKLLMERGADVTIRDIELQSVLHAAVGHPRAMEILLQSPAVMSLITEKDVNGFSAVHYAAKNGDTKNIELFVARNKTAASVTSDSLDTPIHVAAKYGWTDAIEKLMERQNPRILNLQNSAGRTALHYACSQGHDLTTETLLNFGATAERDQNERSPLHMAALKGCRRCCEAVIGKFEDCINWVDKNKNTALHIAAANGHASVVTLLLSHPISEITFNTTSDNILDVAVKEKRSTVVMAIAENDRWREVLTSCTTGVVKTLQKLVEIMPDTVVRFLDQLVTETGDRQKTNYKVNYDLGLIQGKYEQAKVRGRKRTTDSEEKASSQDDVNVAVKSKTKNTVDAPISSLALIETMTIYRREHCLTHPVCYHLLNTKWKKFGWATFMVNLFTYFLFIAPLTWLAVKTRAEENELCGFNSTASDEDKEDYPCTFSSVPVQILSYWVLILAIAHLLKELLSIVAKRLEYLTDGSNYLEWVCYVTAVIYCIPPCDCRAGLKRQVGAITLFFGWMNLILYFRRLSSYGQYVIMLSTMFVTLVKVLLLWMLFIMAFGTTFLMLIDKEPFNEFGTSMMTMFVMTMGELNYHEYFTPWEDLAFSTLTNILFIVLVLGMPIIMMNMLVGLAVGDIDKIQQNALMDRYVKQVQLLVEIENSLPKFILEKIQVYDFTEFPNAPKTLKETIVDTMIRFDKPAVEDNGEEEEISPEMMNALTRIDQQETKIQKMFDLLREQSEMLKEIRQTTQENIEISREEAKQEEPATKSLFGVKDRLSFSPPSFF